jgi:RimJ/RimL family protein N-acetyltransferase
MGWQRADDAEQFAAVAGGFLRSRPVEHTVALTLVETLRSQGPHAYGPDDPIFAWYDTADGTVTGAVLQTPPHPLMVVAAPAPAELAGLLAGHRPTAANTLAGDCFADAWCAATGARFRPARRTRLYRLDELLASSPPGGARVASPGDRAVLESWVDEFHAEIGEAAGPSFVDDRLAYGGFTLWEDGGVPVSLAGNSRLDAGMVRVTLVYTPPACRGRGYGGGVTTAVTRAALDAGADDVVLFTDLANPTSNALYQRLGYRPIEDRMVVEFTYG